MAKTSAGVKALSHQKILKSQLLVRSLVLALGFGPAIHARFFHSDKRDFHFIFYEVFIRAKIVSVTHDFSDPQNAPCWL